jgi:hypothetical protein
MGLHQIKKLLHGKRNNYPNEEKAYSMREKSLLPTHQKMYSYPKYIKNAKN